ncbi:MAG: Bax inhibitor-1/YccA family protein [Planctomycetes bacterium]|nr:Bax inhibitor-1/YccA family protein [Planctomycetota bacterium]
MFRTANPALSERTFADPRTRAEAAGAETLMTVAGTMNRAALLLLVLVAAAFWVWKLFADAGGMSGDLELLPLAAQAVMPWMIGGLIGGLVLALVTIFGRKIAAFTAPLYAVCEGFLIGGLSAFLETRYPGIVLQAVGLTFGVFLALLFIYRTGIIKVTDKFRLGVLAATGAVALVYLVSFLMGFFGVSVPYIHGGGAIGIGFSVVVVVIASLNLVLDFDFIQRGSEMGAPKYMEWYAAFGLIVTLVWLYIEILRLLSKIRRRR